MWNRSLAILITASTTLIAETNASKLEAPLEAICDALKAKGKVGLRKEASTRDVELHGGRVSVRIAVANEGAIPILRKVATEAGARITAAEGSSLFADVPVARLPRLAANALVAGIYLDRPQQRPQTR